MAGKVFYRTSKRTSKESKDKVRTNINWLLELHNTFEYFNLINK